VESLTIEAVELLVARTNFEDRPQPVGQGLGMAQPMAIGNAILRGRDVPSAIGQRVEHTAVPRRAWGEGYLEAQSAIGVDGLRVTAVGSDRQRAHEIAIAVGGPEPLAGG